MRSSSATAIENRKTFSPNEFLMAMILAACTILAFTVQPGECGFGLFQEQLPSKAVQASLDGAVVLPCKLQKGKMISCSVTSPDGKTTLKVKPENAMGFYIQPNYQYMGTGLQNADCSVQINRIEANDGGEWKCALTEQLTELSFVTYSGKITVELFGKPKIVGPINSLVQIGKEHVISFNITANQLPTSVEWQIRDDVYVNSGSTEGAYRARPLIFLSHNMAMAELVIAKISLQDIGRDIKMRVSTPQGSEEIAVKLSRDPNDDHKEEKVGLKETSVEVSNGTSAALEGNIPERVLIELTLLLTIFCFYEIQIQGF